MKASELAERLMRHGSAEVQDVNVVIWYESTDRIELQASGVVTIPRSVVEGQIEGMLRDLRVGGLAEANSTYPPDLSRIPPYQRPRTNTKTGESHNENEAGVESAEIKATGLRGMGLQYRSESETRNEDEYRQMLDGKLHEGEQRRPKQPPFAKLPGLPPNAKERL